ncbi:TIGR03943 family putative permease subunit [Clostridium butyricum]|uniref:TIGR03943 family putative permease subunit n=1 Tax=Clostridium butyricum TaxID=1492 RepID=UPI00168A9D9A|nr:TIGR03943 family protein [Clostridium butyricum]MDB2150351.1 TIGR03943 family protein [Clostridium butyricum]
MKKFNWDEFIWFITLIFMAFGLLYLVNSGKIQFYIGNKMIKYVYFSVVMIAVISLFQIRNIFTPKNNINLKLKYIPIILALVIGIVSVKSQDSFRHIQLNNVLINEYSEDLEDKDQKNIIEGSKYDQFIKIDDNNLNILEDIQASPEEFMGKEIEMYGFVCKESYLKNTQFVIGRIIMTCCAADSKIVGILAEGKNIAELNENEWVTIRGSLSFTTINDDDGISHRVPVIIIDNLTKNNKVENKS